MLNKTVTTNHLHFCLCFVCVLYQCFKRMSVMNLSKIFQHSAILDIGNKSTVKQHIVVTNNYPLIKHNYVTIFSNKIKRTFKYLQLLPKYYLRFGPHVRGYYCITILRKCTRAEVIRKLS